MHLLLVTKRCELLSETVCAPDPKDVHGILEGKADLLGSGPRNLLQESDHGVRKLLDNFGHAENIIHTPKSSSV